MKSNLLPVSPLFLLLLMVLTGTTFAQVIQPATWQTAINFSNPPGAVRTRLENLAGPGMLNIAGSGNTDEAPARTATGTAAAGTRLSGAVNLTLDAAGSPQWRVQATASLAAYGQQYFRGPTAYQVAAPGSVRNSTWSDNVSIVDITFSAAVAGGTILVQSPDGAVTLSQLSALPAGTRAEVVVPPAEPLLIRLAVETGSGGAGGSVRRVVRTISTWNGGAPANSILPVNLNISEAASLGSFSGTLDLTGETELASFTNGAGDGLSKVTATYNSAAFPNYGNWERRTILPGDPSSGAFTLANLTSAASIAANDPGSSYSLQAELFIKHKLPSTNWAAQHLRTRLLSGAAVPAVQVTGTTLGNTFVLNPAWLRGQFTLCGPAAQPGRPAMLSRIFTAADTDGNGDGIPDGAPDPFGWLNGSAVLSSTGAFSGFDGQGFQIMERTYAAPNASVEYELALADPGNGTVNWSHPALNLLMTGTGTTEDTYFNTSYLTSKAAAPAVSLTPGSTATRNDAVNFGEVILTVRSAAGSGVTIWQPSLASTGLTGQAGNAWDVAMRDAFGWPAAAAEAGTRATLRTLLPAGTYTLRPAVHTVSAGGAGSTSLSAITLTVPPCGRVTADNGLAISAAVPLCVGAAAATVNGQITADGAALASVTYQIDGGAVQAAAVGGGANPTFTITLPAGLAAGLHTVTVTVTTTDGRTATSTQQFERDVTTPAVTAPPVMVFNDAPIGGQIVHYPAPVVTDNCGLFSLSCSPPSGSVFPLGTTTVTCTATDAAGNTASDTFTITLLQSCPPPVRSHQYAGNADSNFRHADRAGYHTSVGMTVEAWVKRAEVTRCETIVAQNYSNSFWFGFCPGLRFYRSGGASADADVAVPENLWTHVAVSYDGTKARFYINGQPAGTKTLTNGGTGTPGLVTVGGDYTEGPVANYTFKGNLDEVRLWNIPLGQPAIAANMKQEVHSGSSQVSAFGSGGAFDDLNAAAGTPGGPAAPAPQIEGILPRWLAVPRTVNLINIDGTVDTGTEYAGADKMVIRYDTVPAPRDAVAHFVYRDAPGDQALYIGVTGVRAPIAPWTRAQSWVGVQCYPDRFIFRAPGPAGANTWRFNSRRLDGTLPGASGPPAGQFQRGTGAGDFGALPPGDPLLTTPSPFGLPNAAGDSVEFRIEKSALGGDWQRCIGLSLSHYWISGVGVDAIGPAGGGYDVPSTWAPVTFGGQLPELNSTPVAGGFNLDFAAPPGANCARLETSTTLLDGSWSTLAVPAYDDQTFDHLVRSHYVPTGPGSDPRHFYRLTRP